MFTVRLRPFLRSLEFGTKRSVLHLHQAFSALAADRRTHGLEMPHSLFCFFALTSDCLEAIHKSLVFCFAIRVTSVSSLACIDWLVVVPCFEGACSGAASHHSLTGASLPDREDRGTPHGSRNVCLVCVVCLLARKAARY
jgi:hypothetical protein